MLNIKNKSDIIYISIIFIIFIFALILRSVVYFDSRPIWHDEAPIALTVINNNFISVLPNILDNMKAPPAFWLLTKFFGSFGNYNELALRFFPFLCSIASVFVFHHFSKEILNKKISIIIADFLFAVNCELIYYAQELKQYSGDVLFFCAAIIFFNKMINKPFNLKNSIICLLFSSIIIMFSLPSFFVIGGFILYKIFLFIKKKKINVSSKPVPYSATGSSICSESGSQIKSYIQFIYFLFFNIIFAGISLLYYKQFFADKYNIEITYLSEYWDSGFINIFNSFLALKSLFLYFFYPNTSFIIELVLFIIGIICIFKYKKHITNIIIFSVFFVVSASCMKLYPIYERVALYLLPVVIVILVKSFDSLSKTYIKNTLLIFIFLSSIPVYLFPQYYVDFFKKDVFTRWDGRETLNYIKNKYKPDDKIIINKSSYRTFEYYKTQLNFNSQNYEEFNYKGKNKEEFYNFLNKNSNGKTWIYYVSPGKNNPERIWLDEWRDQNKDYIKSEFIKNKSYILKI